jgi:ribosomal protein S6--L-glutamate ligase
MEPLNIAILSRGAALYSTQSLYAAARRNRHHVRVIDHLRCQIIIGEEEPCIIYEGELLKGTDILIPRIGASVTDYGAAVILQFENMGVYTSTSSEALLLARDKLKCLQYLSANGISVPKTCVAPHPEAVPELIDILGGPPVIVKMPESTHGAGVFLAESTHTAASLVEVFSKLNQQVLLQEFIEETNGTDIRAFVVGKRVVACMQRQATEGEFRSNLHRGAEAIPVRLTPAEEQIVMHATQIMGLQVAGIDLLRSNKGPLLMEVNASPGLEGIETTTEIDIAGEIINHVEDAYLRFTKVKASH